MEVDAINGESEGVFDYATSFRDSCAECISSLGKLCMFPFWRFQTSLSQNILPIHLGEFGQASSLLRERVRRLAFSIFQLPFFLTSLPYAAFGAVCTEFGKLLHSRSYRTLTGAFKGEGIKEKIFFLNTQMMHGGIPYFSAGLAPANERYQRLVTMIRENNPSLVFLAEVNPFCADALTKDLNDRYHYFFINHNQMPPYFFIAFRGSLIKPPEYLPEGYFLLETADTFYFFIHHPSMKYIDQLCALDLEAKKVVLIGDLGCTKDHPIFDKLKARGFIPGIQEEIATETNAPLLHLYNLKKEITEREIPLIFFKGGQINNKIEIVPVYLPEKIDEALSNRKLVLA